MIPLRQTLFPSKQVSPASVAYVAHNAHAALSTPPPSPFPTPLLHSSSVIARIHRNPQSLPDRAEDSAENALYFSNPSIPPNPPAFRTVGCERVLQCADNGWAWDVAERVEGDGVYREGEGAEVLGSGQHDREIGVGGSREEEGPAEEKKYQERG